MTTTSELTVTYWVSDVSMHLASIPLNHNYHKYHFSHDWQHESFSCRTGLSGARAQTAAQCSGGVRYHPPPAPPVHEWETPRHSQPPSDLRVRLVVPPVSVQRRLRLPGRRRHGTRAQCRHGTRAQCRHGTRAQCRPVFTVQSAAPVQIRSSAHPRHGHVW